MVPCRTLSVVSATCPGTIKPAGFANQPVRKERLKAQGKDGRAKYSLGRQQVVMDQVESADSFKDSDSEFTRQIHQHSAPHRILFFLRKCGTADRSGNLRKWKTDMIVTGALACFP